MATCLIGLGANQGDRAARLAAAAQQLSELADISGLRESSVFRSKAAVGGPAQEDFLNSALSFQTSLSPRQVLSVLKRLEARLGRTRQDRWSSREIDLDLLQYDDLVLADSELQVPHPRLAFRRFVLEPLAQIAPATVHPTTGFTIAELLQRLNQSPRHIAITGVTSQPARDLANQVGAQTATVTVVDSPIATFAEETATLRASPASQTAIEFVDQRRHGMRCLRRQHGHRVDAGVTEVRGCWVGECLALANLVLPADAVSEFERSWKEDPDAAELDRTTLIAVLLAPCDDEFAALFQAEIKRLATQPRQSPWMLLDATNPDWALRELVAAVEAMQ